MALPHDVRKQIKDYNEYLNESRRLYVQISRFLSDEYCIELGEPLYNWDGALSILDMDKEINLNKLDEILDAIDNLYNETGEIPDYKDVINYLNK